MVQASRVKTLKQCTRAHIVLIPHVYCVCSAVFFLPNIQSCCCWFTLGGVLLWLTLLLLKSVCLCVRHSINLHPVQPSKQISLHHPSAQKVDHLYTPVPHESVHATGQTHTHAHIHIHAGKAITCGSLTLRVFVGCRTIRSCCCYVRSRQSGSPRCSSCPILSL